MKFKILGTLFVLVILIVLYAVFNANKVDPNAYPEQGTTEVQQ